MISITRLAQSKKNLEQDLKRICDTAKKEAETKQGTMSFPSTRSMEEMALKSIGHDLTEEEKAILQETSAWKAMVRCGKIMDRLSTMLSPFNRLAPPFMAISYDLVVHPFLYEDWRLNYAEIDFTQFDMSLSSSEIYDVFQQCNSDLISVFVSKLDNCSQAEKEHIIAAYENGNREEFIKHLRLLSNEDYRILCLFAYLFHIENSLVSFDEDTLNVLLHVVDFGDEVRLSAGDLLPCKEIIDFISFPQDFELKDNPTEEEVVAYFNKISDVFEPYLKNLEAFYSYLKYDLPRVFESMNPFPFERKYLEDLLNDPEVKAILADLSEKPNENAAPDVQEQPEEAVAKAEGQKKSNAGNNPKPWIKASMNEDIIKKRLEEEVWFGIKEDLDALDYLDKSGVRKDTVKKSFGAAFIFYSAHSLGLTVEKKYSKSAERSFSFLPGPRTSVNAYLDKLHLWFTKLYEANFSRKGNIDRKTLDQWKILDKFKADFIINNYLKLCPLFNNTKYLLGKAFRIETGLELEGPGQSSDLVLGGAERYNDNVEIKNDGHHSKTALPLSYSDDD